ncbi:putative lysine methyltransferase [Rosellinia necatrix]|uniref:Putative lysine methyltransferase n=1 Tax=Rosellinia necatrix TaxID=77044 RepID=A0A1S8AB69_ROSNE|nr:putative lysine methyltransferase [Rosellinia necatrix]
MYWQYYALVSLRTVSGCALSSICSIPDAFAQLQPFSLDHGNFESLGNSTSGSPSGPCYKAGADEYCAYTDVYFNREGVSVITTADSITHIAKRTAFQNGASVPRINACYVEVELPGKGRGLVATEAIAAGQTLISRTPALVVNTNAVKGLGRDELDDLLAHAVDGLPSTHRDEVLGLSTHDRAKTHQEKVGKIFRTNSFSTGFHDGKSNFQSLFTEGTSFLLSPFPFSLLSLSLSLFLRFQ